MTGPSFTVEQSLEAQAASARHGGSPIYGHLLEGLLADYRDGGITAELLEGVSTKPGHDAVPLRYLATAHRLALADSAPDLARYYGSCGGVWQGEDLVPVFIAEVHRHRAEFVAGLQRNVQTNEVGRAPVLASAFALLTRRHERELDLLEIGSSAGLLSRWDQYFYDTGSSTLGKVDSPLRFDASWWNGTAPDLSGGVRVARRCGSDIHPIDATTTDGRVTMLSFIWPDQPERIARLRAGLDVAAHFPLTVDRADAGDWLTEHLAPGQRLGCTTVVFHSIVWQYLPKSTRDRVRGALSEAGARATTKAPLAWLRMEPATSTFANVRLTTWPGGDDEVLAEVGYHGAGIRWLVPD